MQVLVAPVKQNQSCEGLDGSLELLTHSHVTKGPTCAPLARGGSGGAYLTSRILIGKRVWDRWISSSMLNQGTPSTWATVQLALSRAMSIWTLG